MMGSGQPQSIELRPTEWLADANLRRCSHAARGVWLDMLCLMMACDAQGALATGDQPWTRAEIAHAVGGDRDAALAAIDELVAKGVAGVRDDGALVSESMVRQHQIRRARAEAGRRGGSKRASHTGGNGVGASDYPQWFEDWWASLSRRSGGKRAAYKAAEKTRAKVGDARMQEIAERYGAYADAVKHAHTPAHVSTYLNEERYEDDPETERRDDGKPTHYVESGRQYGW